MPYKDFRGNDVDLSGWTDGQINRAHANGRLIWTPDDPATTPASPAKKTAAKRTTAKKSTAKKTTKK